MSRTPPPAFVSLLQAQQEPLVRAARLLTGDWDRAEDLLLRTLTWALTNWSTIERKAAPAGLLIRQELISLYLADAEDPYSGLEEPPPAPAASEPAPSLMEALALLTPRSRVIAVGRYYLSLSPAEIGHVVDHSPEEVGENAVSILAALQWSTVRAGGEG